MVSNVAAWGENNYGQCNVPDGLVATAVAAGGEHSLALRPDGSVVAWGRNNYGQCNVPDGLVATAITCSYDASCALRPDGSVAAWGLLCSPLLSPATPPDGLIATAISAGDYEVAALRPDGSVIVWGGTDVNNFGHGTVKAGLTATAIAVGINFVIAIRPDGSVAVWSAHQDWYVPVGLEAKAIEGGWRPVVIRQDGSFGYWLRSIEDCEFITPFEGATATSIASLRDHYLVAGYIPAPVSPSRRKRAAWAAMERPLFL